MNRQIRILVEGVRDLAFLTAYLSNRYISDAGEFSQNKTDFKESDKFRNDVLFELVQPSEVSISIHRIGGVDKFENAKQSFEDKAQETEGIIPVVIFDADTVSHPHGGVPTRLDYLKEVFSGWRFQTNPISDLHAFLFPNNQDEGELETLLERIAREENRSYFSKCWDPFAQAIKECQYHQPTQTKMNEYVSAVWGKKAWDDQGLNRALFIEDLWDWDSPALEPLNKFFDKLLMLSY